MLTDVGPSLTRLENATVDAYAAGLRQSGFNVTTTPDTRRDLERRVR